MATFRIDAGDDATGTINNDLFRIVTTEDDLTSENPEIDGLSGVDEAQILDTDGDDLVLLDSTSDLSATVISGEYTATYAVNDGDDDTPDVAPGGDDDTLTLKNFEVFTFANGSLTSAATGASLQYLQRFDTTFDDVLSSSNKTAVDFTDDASVFVWNGATLSDSADFEMTHVNGVEFDASVVQVSGVGTVINNGGGLDLQLASSAFDGLGWGEMKTIELDVTYTDDNDPNNDADDVSFTEEFSFDLVGSATDGNDRYSTQMVAGDQAVALDGLAGNDFIVGDEGDDTIYGNDGNDEIYAGSSDDGDDEFAGGAGHDIIGGGAGNDILTGDDNSDVSAAVGADFSARADGNDLIFGGAGDDDIYTGSVDFTNFFTITGTGTDTAWAGEGNDNVWGDNGIDVLGGGAGADFIFAGDGNDIVYGGRQDDDTSASWTRTQVLYGEDGNDLMYGGASDDEVVDGGNGNDIIYNGDGDDKDIYGGNGADTLWGGKGDDYLYGEAGVDIFAFVVGNGNDQVDYVDGEDFLDLSNVDGFDANDLTTGTVNGNTVLYYGDGTDSITFNGSVNLTSADFTNTAMSDFG